MQAMMTTDRRREDDGISDRIHILLAMGGAAAKPLQGILTTAGFQVKTVDTAALVVKTIHREKPDVIVLDARFQRYHYLAICQNIDQLPFDTQLLVLLPTRDTTSLLQSLDHGADDCLAAPFGHTEVLVRIRVLLNRLHQQAQARRSYPHIEIIPTERLVIIDGTKLHLTVLEFDLIAALANQPGTVIPRARLAQLVWGDDWVGDCRVVDSHICRLRRKLQSSGLRQPCVHSIRGIGYVFRPED